MRLRARKTVQKRAVNRGESERHSRAIRLASSWLIAVLTLCYPAGKLQAATADCTNVRELLAEGERLLHQNDIQHAIQSFRRAYDECPKTSAAGVELARAYLSARDFHAAELTAKEVLANEPNLDSALFLLAYSYFMQERFADAGNRLREFLDRHPEDVAAHKLMGLILFFYKEYSSSEHELSIAVQENPKDREALYYLGRVYESQNDVQQAIDIFQKLVAQDPDDYKSADHLALCYAGIGRNGEAEVTFRQAQEAAKKKNPAYDWAYSNYAEMLIQQDRPGEAIPAATQALKINPDSSRNNYLMGAALAAKGDPDAALPYLQKSVAIDSKFAESHKVLGDVYRKLHQLDKAENEYKIFAELKRQSPAKHQ